MNPTPPRAADRPLRVLIVVNPAAGSAEALGDGVTAAAELWRGLGWQVEIQPTAGAGDATRLARTAADQHYDLVAAAGGDGTVNEVVNGLAHQPTAMAPLPAGTVNVWARELGLPMQPAAAASALAGGTIRTVDLGRAGERYFLLMAGIGFDAAVTAEVDAPLKRRLGALAYAVRAVQLARQFQGTSTRLWLDGRPRRARVLNIVVGNSRLYGGIVQVTHRARIDDGLLDVAVVRGDHPWALPRHVLTLLLRRHTSAIDYYRVRSLRIRTRRPLRVQVDGDAAGMTPLLIEVVPAALRVLLPAGAPAALFMNGSGG